MIIQWFEFVVEAACGNPETYCSRCGRQTYLAWRTGFCRKHNPGPAFTADDYDVNAIAV